MKELAKSWILEINRKKSIMLLLKEHHFSFCIMTDKEKICLRVENSSLKMNADRDVFPAKKLIGKEEVFCTIFSGQQKLRKLVEKEEIETTLSYREQLLLESLFYLARQPI